MRSYNVLVKTTRKKSPFKSKSWFWGGMQGCRNYQELGACCEPIRIPRVSSHLLSSSTPPASPFFPPTTRFPAKSSKNWNRASRTTWFRRPAGRSRDPSHIGSIGGGTRSFDWEISCIWRINFWSISPWQGWGRTVGGWGSKMMLLVVCLLLLRQIGLVRL